MQGMEGHRRDPRELGDGGALQIIGASIPFPVLFVALCVARKEANNALSFSLHRTGGAHGLVRWQHPSLFPFSLTVSMKYIYMRLVPCAFSRHITIEQNPKSKINKYQIHVTFVLAYFPFEVFSNKKIQ
jgi:hypothetical protein